MTTYITNNFSDLYKKRHDKSFDDTELYNILNCVGGIGVELGYNGPWVAGGSVLKTYLDQPLDSDIDIFFQGDSQFIDTNTKFAYNCKLIGDTKFTKTYEFVYEHNNVETKRKVQLISFKFYPTLATLLDSFDISVCRIGFDGEGVIMADSFESDVFTKSMTVNVSDIRDPVITLKRIVKYAGRGFKISDKNLDYFLEKYLNISVDKNKPDDYGS